MVFGHRMCILRRGKKQRADKLDNLAAKPFFLGIISRTPVFTSLRFPRATLVLFPADNTYTPALAPVLVSRAPFLVSPVLFPPAMGCLASPKSAVTDSSKGMTFVGQDESQYRTAPRSIPLRKIRSAAV